MHPGSHRYGRERDLINKDLAPVPHSRPENSPPTEYVPAGRWPPPTRPTRQLSAHVKAHQRISTHINAYQRPSSRRPFLSTCPFPRYPGHCRLRMLCAVRRADMGSVYARVRIGPACNTRVCADARVACVYAHVRTLEIRSPSKANTRKCACRNTQYST